MLVAAGLLTSFYFIDGINGIRDFLFWFWTYNLEYYILGIEPIYRVQTIFVPLAILINDFFPIAVLFFTGVVYSIYNFTSGIRNSRLHNDSYGVFFVIWFIFSCFATSLSGRGFGHYFIHFLPALSLVSGIAADTLIGSCSKIRTRLSVLLFSLFIFSTLLYSYLSLSRGVFLILKTFNLTNRG